MTEDSKIDYTGSSFDSFLEEDGILEEVDATARERVRAWQEATSSNRAQLLQTSVEILQQATCKKYGAQHVRVSGDSKLGFAASTKGRLPINGMRNPPSGDTSGWYLWCGTEFSDAPDFFVPLHVRHVYEDYPEIASLLGLPPGYRFLLAGEYLDVWYDSSLLNV